MKKFIICLDDENILEKIKENKFGINEKVIISIRKEFKDKELIEKRLTKLLIELSDKNREIIIENNNQEYHISLDSINFKKIILKDLIREEKIVFINLKSIRLSINNGFYEILETYCEEIIIKNRKIRSINFINTKINNIGFEFLKLNNLIFKNSEVKHMDFKKLNIRKEFIIKNSNINNLLAENIFLNNLKISKNSNFGIFSLKKSTIKEKFSISDSELKDFVLNDENRIKKLTIHKTVLTKSFKLKSTNIIILDLGSSSSFKGDNFRINNCDINYAKFESVNFSADTTQFYYNKNIKENINNIIFKNCIFNSYKTTFSNGKYYLISFYESIFDTYFYFNPELVQNIDFGNAHNYNFFNFKYEFEKIEKMEKIDFTYFINTGNFILPSLSYINSKNDLENLYNKLVNYNNYISFKCDYEAFYKGINNEKGYNIVKELEHNQNNKHISIENKKEYIKVNFYLFKEMFYQNNLYTIEDYFYNKYNDDIFYQDRNTGLKEYLIHYLYKISDYGSNYNKIIKCMIIIILLFSTLIMIFTCLYPNAIIKANDTNIFSFYDSLYFTVVTFFTVGYGDYEPIIPMVKFISGIISFTGVFLSSYLIAVFARKMMRK